MQLTIVSGNRPLYSAPSVLTSQRTESTAPSQGDAFRSSGLEELSLIRPGMVSPEKGTKLRETSPLLSESLSLAGMVAAQSIPGASPLNAVDKTEILSLFDRWNGALQTGDPNQVVKEYAPDAILLPTVSNKVRHNHAEIKDYFDHFLAKGPKGTIDESNIRQFGDIAINSGIYTFDFANGEKVTARYTFVYQKLDGEWKIAEHHSSALPEKTP